MYNIHVCMYTLWSFSALEFHFRLPTACLITRKRMNVTSFRCIKKERASGRKTPDLCESVSLVYLKHILLPLYIDWCSTIQLLNLKKKNKGIWPQVLATSSWTHTQFIFPCQCLLSSLMFLLVFSSSRWLKNWFNNSIYVFLLRWL